MINKQQWATIQKMMKFSDEQMNNIYQLYPEIQVCDNPNGLHGISPKYMVVDEISQIPPKYTGAKIIK